MFSIMLLISLVISFFLVVRKLRIIFFCTRVGRLHDYVRTARTVVGGRGREVPSRSIVP